MKGRKMLGKIIVPFIAGALGFCAVSLIKSLPVISTALGAADSLNRAIDLIGVKSGTSALMKALLTGNKGYLDKETIEIFRISGASHLLALSGLHLGFIYGLIKKFLSPFGNSPVIRAIRTGITLGLCSFYTIMTGSGPSIVRALLFIVTNEACSLDPERKRSSIGILFMAFVTQVTATPGVINSIGFQLSYLAMAGIFLVGLPMQKWYPSGKHPDILKKIWDAAAISISCQLFTAPVSWYHFHSFPLHFLLTNIIALPVTEAAIAVSIVTIATEDCKLNCGPLPDICDFIFGLLVRILGTISGM